MERQKSTRNTKETIEIIRAQGYKF